MQSYYQQGKVEYSIIYLMQQQNLKPAVILDDDRDWATNIARGVRRFGGLPVRYFASIEAFYRQHRITYGDKQGLARALEEYSVVVSDNNFEVPRPERELEADGEIRGADFLIGQVGPALKDIAEENRPIVMCFAPSSMSVLAGYEKEMWNEFGIVSFHKTWETAAVGLSVRIAKEYGVLLSREAVISAICKQDPKEDEYGSPKAEFFFNFRADHTEFEEFSAEGHTQVEGDARPMEWEEIVASLAQRLDTTSELLSNTIDMEVKKRRSELEGRGKHPEKGS